MAPMAQNDQKTRKHQKPKLHNNYKTKVEAEKMTNQCLA